MTDQEIRTIIFEWLKPFIPEIKDRVQSHTPVVQYLSRLMIKHQIPFSSETIFLDAYNNFDVLKAQVVLQRLTK